MSFHLPVTPIVASVFFILSVVLIFKRGSNSFWANWKNFFSVNKHIISLFLASYLFFVVTMVFGYDVIPGTVLPYLHQALGRGLLFLLLLFCVASTKAFLSVKQLSRVFFYSGALISVAGLMKVFKNYLFFFPPEWTAYNSSLVRDYNYAMVPVLLGFAALLFQLKLKNKQHWPLFFLFTACLYFSSSRRAYLVLNLFLLIHLFQGRRLTSFTKPVIMATLLFICPIFNAGIASRLSKTAVTVISGDNKTWVVRSPLYQFRYLRLFGINATYRELVRIRSEIKCLFIECTGSSPLAQKASGDTTGDGHDSGYTTGRDYDSGGRFERWQFTLKLLKERDWRGLLLGGGFEYLEQFSAKFDRKAKVDYPHLMGASVLLYSGGLGLLFFLVFMCVSSYRVYVIGNVFLRASYGVVFLAAFVSLDILFTIYLNMFMFSIVCFLEPKKSPLNLLNKMDIFKPRAIRPMKGVQDEKKANREVVNGIHSLHGGV